MRIITDSIYVLLLILKFLYTKEDKEEGYIFSLLCDMQFDGRNKESTKLHYRSVIAAAILALFRGEIRA